MPSCFPLFHNNWRGLALKIIGYLENQELISAPAFILKEKINLACRKIRGKRAIVDESNKIFEDYESYTEVRAALLSITIFTVLDSYRLVMAISSLKYRYRFIDLGSYKHNPIEYQYLLDQAERALKRPVDETESRLTKLYKRLTRLVDAAIMQCTPIPYISKALELAKEFHGEDWGFQEKLDTIKNLFDEKKFNRNWKAEALFFIQKLSSCTAIQGMSEVRVKIRKAIEQGKLPGFEKRDSQAGDPLEQVRNFLMMTTLDSAFSRYKLVVRLNDYTITSPRMISLPDDLTHSASPTDFMIKKPKEKEKRRRSKSEVKPSKKEHVLGRGRGMSLPKLLSSHYKSHKTKLSDEQVFSLVKEDEKTLGDIHDSMDPDFEDYLENHKARHDFPEWEKSIQKVFISELGHISISKWLTRYYKKLKNLLFLAVLHGDKRWFEICFAYSEALTRFNPPRQESSYLSLLSSKARSSRGGEDSFSEVRDEVGSLFQRGIDRAWKINCMEFTTKVNAYLDEIDDGSLFKKNLELVLISDLPEWKEISQFKTLENLRILLESTNLHLTLCKYKVVAILESLKKRQLAEELESLKKQQFMEEVEETAFVKSDTFLEKESQVAETVFVKSDASNVSKIHLFSLLQENENLQFEVVAFLAERGCIIAERELMLCLEAREILKKRNIDPVELHGMLKEFKEPH